MSNEHPIGFVVLNDLQSGDELDQVKQEVQAMLDAYDGSAPFPEWAEHYMQAHPSRWDFHALAQFLMPPNDPRNKPVPKHDGKLSDHHRIRYASEWHIQGVRIEEGEGPEQAMFLLPHRALSLLAWLQQEELELQRLAKERERG